MAKALVLEGGGKRGIYTAGVLDVLLEKGISVDAVFGVSAGAIHGASFVSGQHERSIRYNLEYGSDPRFMSLRNWIRTGNVVDVDFCYRELPEELDVFDHKAFEQSKTKFFAVCSNVVTGKAEYVHCPNLHQNDGIDYLRASASLPFFSKIVKIGQKKFLDGGICDSIPLKAAQNLGYEKNLVVLTRPKGYQKKPSKNKLLAKIVYAKFPKFVKAIVDRYKMYNDQLKFVEQEQAKGKTLVLQPSKTIKIGRMEQNPEVVKQMYKLGRKDALANWKKIQEFFAE